MSKVNLLERFAGMEEAYIALGLNLGYLARQRFGEKDGGYYIDFYYGPQDLKRFQTSGRYSADQCAQLAEQMQEGLKTQIQDPLRRQYLQEQVAAMHMFARLLDGEGISFTEHVEKGYGIKPFRLM